LTSACFCRSFLVRMDNRGILAATKPSQPGRPLRSITESPKEGTAQMAADCVHFINGLTRYFRTLSEGMLLSRKPQSQIEKAPSPADGQTMRVNRASIRNKISWGESFNEMTMQLEKHSGPKVRTFGANS